jgi:hypothetical protein
MIACFLREHHQSARLICHFTVTIIREVTNR